MREEGFLPDYFAAAAITGPAFAEAYVDRALLRSYPLLGGGATIRIKGNEIKQLRQLRAQCIQFINRKIP
ncbi:MAG: hypothetical protein ACYCUI_15020 [Vulcanimicrobiaceae bacterium]